MWFLMKWIKHDHKKQTLGNGRYNDGRDREAWNHDEGNQHAEDQEDLTRKPPGMM